MNPKTEKLEKLKGEHKSSGPYNSAIDAVRSPTYKAAHKEIKTLKSNNAKSKALQNKK